MRQWFGSSAPASAGARAPESAERAPAKRIERLGLALCLVLGLAGAAPSPGPQNAEFLALPEKELEPLGTGAANADPQIEVGDTYWLKIAAPVEGELVSAAPPDGASSLSELGWEVGLRKAEGGPGKGQWEIGATPLKPGRLTLPALALLGEGGKPVARTRPFTLDVASAIEPGDPQPQKPVPVKPPSPVPFPWVLAAAVALLGIVGASGAVLGFLRWRERRANRASALPEAQRPEDALAMEALDGVEREGWVKAAQFKKHYFRVSEILKRYLGLRYGFEAAESTTRELVRTLEERRYCDASAIDRIESLFERMDRVKFTDELPDADSADRIVAEARAIVQSTRRAPLAASAPTPSSGSGVTHALR